MGGLANLDSDVNLTEDPSLAGWTVNQIDLERLRTQEN
jgi:hypothetical protein